MREEKSVPRATCGTGTGAFPVTVVVAGVELLPGAAVLAEAGALPGASWVAGAARLAVDMQVPILPIAHNAGWLWPRGVMGKRPGVVTLSIGAPIAPGAMGAAELMLAVESWIEGEVARLGPA